MWIISIIWVVNFASCTREINPMTATAKAAVNKETLFTSKLDLNLRKKLVKCYIWSIALCGAETRTLRNVDRKHMESFEMWYFRMTEKIIWTDRVKNEEVLHRVKEEINILHTIKEERLTGLVTYCSGTAL
jgi:hypothetical protein